MLWVRLILVAVILSGCVHEPTTVSESDQSLLERSFDFEKSNRPVKLSKETVVLDVRSFFDYETATVPEAVYINPDEFELNYFYGQDSEEKATILARRLALLGVTPFSHVVVMGYGMKGQGEEGRVALTLLALGVEHVQIVTENQFKLKFTNKKKNQKPNQRYWEPRVVASLFCSALPRKDTMFVLNVDRKSKNSPGFTQRLANVYVDWSEFIKRDNFAPNVNARKVLSGHKIEESSPVMVRGQNAALVTFNMVQMGYRQVCMMKNN
jgi:hypothetical protein